MILVAQLIALIVLALIGAGMALAASGRRSAAHAAQAVAAAVPIPPAALVDAGGPEDALRGRLRQALAAFRAGAHINDPDLFEARVAFEHQAVLVDERLIEVAGMPAPERGAPLARVIAAVDALEQAATVLDATGASPERPARLDAALVQVSACVAILGHPIAAPEDAKRA